MTRWRWSYDITRIDLKTRLSYSTTYFSFTFRKIFYFIIGNMIKIESMSCQKYTNAEQSDRSGKKHQYKWSLTIAVVNWNNWLDDVHINNFRKKKCDLESNFFSRFNLNTDIGRIQTLLRESVKYLNSGKLLWSGDSPSKVSPLLKIWVPLAQRAMINWPKCLSFSLREKYAKKMKN